MDLVLVLEPKVGRMGKTESVSGMLKKLKNRANYPVF